ncbi:MAG: FG-GAP-like repeat-containing protein [Bacteroidota bacterium]|nr:FG-GAP-like repeat-containing protein [Bacteroidota bacterium]
MKTSNVFLKLIFILHLVLALPVLMIAQTTVTFQVNMKIKMLKGTFLPSAGDIVTVRGSFNDWGFDPSGNVDTLFDFDNDSIYTRTEEMSAGYMEYKFWKTLRSELDWESGSNRAYTVISGSQTLHVVYFDYDSEYDPAAIPTITNISPQSGAVGAFVTITGTNYSSTPAENIVYFGAVKASVTSATSTALEVIVPTGATYSPITVTINGLTAYSSIPFIVTFASSYSIDYGAFAGKVDFANESIPFLLAIGDLDGDGKPDVASASQDSSCFMLFRNTSTSGSISFATSIKLETGFRSYNVFINDIDGDGKLDLISAMYEPDNRVAVFRNTSTPGSFSFEGRVDFAVGGSPRRVAISDFDGDGCQTLQYRAWVMIRFQF